MAKAKKTEKDIDETPSTAGMSFLQRRNVGLQDSMKGIMKKYGKSAIMLPSAESAYQSVWRLQSGVFILDHALGGGWPRGRVNLIWGGKSCTKTTLMLKMIAIAQQIDVLTNRFLWELSDKERATAVPMKVAYIDAEGTLDFQWAAAHGVNIEDLLYARPLSLEEAGDAIEALFKTNAIDVCVFDSLVSVSPQAEIEGDMSDQQMGVSARVSGKMFRKVQRALNEIYRSGMLNKERADPTFFVLNQLRNKIGVMFGSPDVKSGGFAQDFFSTTEVKLSGNKVAFFDPDHKKFPKWAEFDFRVEKNKVSAPKIEGSFKMALADDPEGSFLSGTIIDQKEVIDLAENVGAIVHEGNNWNYLSAADAAPDTFKTKTELLEKHVHTVSNYLLFKRALLKRLHPKQ